MNDTPADDTPGESFAEFLGSFFYGSRNDLSFKFLKALPEERAAEFFRALLERLGDAFDTGEVLPLIELAYEAQIEGYAGRDLEPWIYDSGSFAEMQKPLSESRVQLLTSSGHFVEGDDPEPFGVRDMTQEEAVQRIGEFLREAPELSVIPRDADERDLRVRHGGYDVRGIRRDPNVGFPRDRLVEAEAAGRIGELAPEILSFPGATAQGRLRQLLPEWVARVGNAEVDVALLVPL
ncbi:MAG: glycine/sarcosine/betaine reductase selenoprotein B family protein [Longimicrobiales bacterium]|nr:glycine/sarcosine/betaine reductase selenoprotein B family protein [Longimicrobiales bacterium]